MAKIIKFRAAVIIFITCVMASVLFTSLYHYDNKYSRGTSMPQDGIVSVSDSQEEDGSSSQEITWLVQGWDFYPDQRIYPGDVRGESVPIYIGQYFSFSGFHKDGSPHGVGTYCLNLRGNGSYTMLIPEVFSACTVYVNGEQVASSGSISPYKPYIKDLMFSFEINGEAEILIQTATGRKTRRFWT